MSSRSHVLTVVLEDYYHYMPRTSLVGFHRGYDLVLLMAPLVRNRGPSLDADHAAALRVLLLVLFSIPALNWIATESVLSR